ncbi:hypothetical protein [Carboxylicivirga sp. N1Y90]|uniref:hypothetical protein n=1 Tax=Carboxylicivirga fragile TaxID=3417571 RepID=UPI003D334EB9|nr:hypothetical protein [Marinilabiliaceae bacterium N1Y90]
MITKRNFFKYIFLISFASLMVSCEMELPEDEMITLADVEVSTEANATNQIIGEFDKLQYYTVKFESTISLPADVRYKAEISNSNLPEGSIVEINGDVLLNKGNDSQDYELLLIDCSKIPFGTVTYTFDLTLTEIDKAINNTFINCKLERLSPDPIFNFFTGGFWGWMDATSSWAKLNPMTNGDLTWQGFDFYWYSATDDWPVQRFWTGIWLRPDNKLTLDPKAAKIAYKVIDGVNYINFLEEDEIINEKSFEWFESNGDAYAIPIVHEEQFGKSGYIATRIKFYGVDVNAWTYVSISDDGLVMNIYEHCMETQGLSIKAGQVE